MALIEYLLDTSVITRLGAPAVRGRVEPLVRSGSIALCGVVVAEVLRGTRSPDHSRETLAQLRAYFWLPTPDDVWDRLLEVQASLGERGEHQSVKVPDLLVAAVASRNRVAVLHYDRDFDGIAAVTEQPCEWVVPPGSAP